MGQGQNGVTKLLVFYFILLLLLFFTNGERGTKLIFIDNISIVCDTNENLGRKNITM
jgi:hypothetical protein